MDLLSAQAGNAVKCSMPVASRMLEDDSISINRIRAAVLDYTEQVKDDHRYGLAGRHCAVGAGGSWRSPMFDRLKQTEPKTRIAKKLSPHVLHARIYM